jgi:DNA polymerase I-like protein with 3'-5' exonuclease and polymerase domains
MLSNRPCTAFFVRWRVLMPVLSITQHDEILVEARDGIEDQVEAIVKESMEEAFQQIIPEVPFDVEIRRADPWK